MGYVLVELAVGSSLIAGIGGGVYLGVDYLRGEHTAVASAPERPTPPAELLPAPTPPPPLVEPIVPTPTVVPAEPKAEPTGWAFDPAWTFMDRPDADLMQPLLTGEVAKVKFNRGGSSLSLRIEFADGSRAAFKPDQINFQTIPRKEIAAYRISRLLGIYAVPPAAPRKFPRSVLVDKLEPGNKELAPRLTAETKVDDEGYVFGEVSYWIPKIEDFSLGGFKIDSVDGMVTWKRFLQIGNKKIPPGVEPLLPQLSTMLVFDYLINNSDRWSGSNAKGSPDGKMLYYMDNTLAFGPEKEGHTRVRIYLERSKKFSKTLVAAIRKLDEKALRMAVTTNTAPYPRLLTDAEIRAVVHRKQRFLEYVDALIQEHGEDVVLPYP
jgi:hypothetical protein